VFACGGGDAGVGEDRLEGSPELSGPVTDQNLKVGSPVTEVHPQAKPLWEGGRIPVRGGRDGRRDLSSALLGAGCDSHTTEAEGVLDLTDLRLG
jgi:hypothetical protein